jgi:hypothetical protein
MSRIVSCISGARARQYSAEASAITADFHFWEIGRLATRALRPLAGASVSDRLSSRGTSACLGRLESSTNSPVLSVGFSPDDSRLRRRTAPFRVFCRLGWFNPILLICLTFSYDSIIIPSYKHTYRHQDQQC